MAEMCTMIQEHFIYDDVQKSGKACLYIVSINLSRTSKTVQYENDREKLRATYLK